MIIEKSLSSNKFSGYTLEILYHGYLLGIAWEQWLLSDILKFENAKGLVFFHV